MSHAVALFARPFYFLRHGETDTNARGLVAGSIDIELTARGRDQAQAAARVFARHPITGIYASPLKRARQTAEPIAQALGLTLVLVPELAERSWGVLEGQPRSLRERGVVPQGAETPEVFANRVLAGLARIDAEVPLVVAHSGVFRVLCRTLHIVETEAPVTNALPLRFAPLPHGGWRLEEA
jgi:broad specificity phosphatase PhoE